MSNSKRFKIILPEYLNKDLNLNIKKNSKYMRRKLVLYIEDKKTFEETDELVNAYLEMADINLNICEMGLADEMSQLNQYETELAESDVPDDYKHGNKRRYILC